MTREPLPWDDPNRDIGADMVATVGGRILSAYPHLDATAAAHVAARHIGRTFTLGQESIAEAIRQITRSDETSVAVLNLFTDDVHASKHHVWTQPDDPDAPSYPIDTQRRRPVYGRITEVDIDLDHKRIGAEFERLLKKHRADEAFWSIRSSMDVLAWLDRRRDPRYRTGWERIFPADHHRGGSWHRPRGHGKTREHAEAVNRMMALGAGHMDVGPGYVSWYDEPHRNRDIYPLDWFSDDRLEQYRQVVAQVVADDIDRLSRESGVPRHLIDSGSHRGWFTTYDDPPADFDGVDTGQHNHVES